MAFLATAPDTLDIDAWHMQLRLGGEQSPPKSDRMISNKEMTIGESDGFPAREINDYDAFSFVSCYEAPCKES